MRDQEGGPVPQGGPSASAQGAVVEQGAGAQGGPVEEQGSSQDAELRRRRLARFGGDGAVQ